MSDPTRRNAISKRTIQWWSSLTPDEYAATCASRKESANQPDVVERKTHLGERNGMFGKTHTDEVKAMLSKNATERFKDKSYEDLYGEEGSEQLKAKRKQQLIDAHKNRNWSGTANPNAKRVVVKGIEFATSSDAAVYYKKSRSTISEWLRKYEDCYFVVTEEK